MKEELNYTSPTTSKAIADLGIKWKASKYWAPVLGQNKYILKNKDEHFRKVYPAYNLTELGHLIPFGFFNKMKVLKLVTTYFKVQLSDDRWETFTSEVEARACFLIDLIVSGKAQVDECAKHDERVQVASKQAPPINK